MSTRIRNCENHVKSVDKISDICRSIMKEIEKIDVKIKELKRKSPNDYGHVLPN